MADLLLSGQMHWRAATKSAGEKQYVVGCTRQGAAIRAFLAQQRVELGQYDGRPRARWVLS